MFSNSKMSEFDPRGGSVFFRLFWNLKLSKFPKIFTTSKIFVGDFRIIMITRHQIQKFLMSSMTWSLSVWVDMKLPMSGNGLPDKYLFLWLELLYWVLFTNRSLNYRLIFAEQLLARFQHERYSSHFLASFYHELRDGVSYRGLVIKFSLLWIETDFAMLQEHEYDINDLHITKQII